MIVTIETNLTPPLTFDTKVTKANYFFKFLRPSITLNKVPLVGDLQFEPQGAPIHGLGMFVFIVLVGIFVLGVWKLFR